MSNAETRRKLAETLKRFETYPTNISDEKAILHELIQIVFNESERNSKLERIGFLYEELTHAELDLFVGSSTKEKGKKWIAIITALIAWIPVFIFSSFYLVAKGIKIGIQQVLTWRPFQ